jgi:hypothetical protein
MEENKELNPDTLNILRCVMKISSAFNDLDEIVYRKKYYKFKFKKEADSWSRLMYIHTSELMKSLVEENEALLIEVYKIIEESTSKVQLRTPEMTSLVLFYCKIKSAINDIELMQKERNSFYPRFIELSTNKVIKEIEKQYSSILDLKDHKDRDINYVSDFFNNLGDKIMNYD